MVGELFRRAVGEAAIKDGETVDPGLPSALEGTPYPETGKTVEKPILKGEIR